jgi:plastocyanin
MTSGRKIERLKMANNGILGTLAILLGAILSDAQAASPPHRVVQASRKFDPKEVSIRVGEALNIINRDDFIHEIYISADAMNFESNEQSPGQTVTVYFPSAGTFSVRCHIHPRMLLTVHVK